MLADGLGLDIDTLLRVAERYTREVGAGSPNDEAVRAALASAHVRHTFPSQKILLSRAAFGRVLADLTDAHLLLDVPGRVSRRLRTVDIPLLAQAPQGRPLVVPRPPPAGHEQTLDRWLVGLDDRIDEYSVQSSSGDRILIGATIMLAVLNWGHLEEELTCGTVVGSNPPAVDDVLLHCSPMLLRDLADDTTTTTQLADGEPLVVANRGWRFHQSHGADWLAFRPDIAAGLAWRPDPTCPGRWLTASGELATERIWWVDGWWGRAGPCFDDTEAYGHAVVLTIAGLADVSGALGVTTRHFKLARWGRRDDGTEADPVVARRESRL
jgi:hypothetical protein